jgi:hypothetical protein
MSHHIDELAKSLAEEPIPRRHAFRLFGAALAGAILGPLGLQTARAGPPDPCRALCNQCPRSQRSQCLADCRACTQTGGHLCGTCNGYGCCAGSQACCGNYCADLDNDVHNCDACFNDCWSGAGANEEAACIDGKCVYDCRQGTVDCNGTCTNLGWDPDNCGACGNVCPDTEPYCNGNGVCFDPGCAPGLTWCQNYCTDLNWDQWNCGACGRACSQAEACSGGQCQGICVGCG